MRFILKIMGYRIYGTHAKFLRYSLPSLSSLSSSVLVVSAVPTVSTASSLVAVISVKIVEIDTSFFTLFLAFEDTYWNNALFYCN